MKTLNLYLNSYYKALKSNFMLVLIAVVLLAITFFIWVGVSIFIIPNIILEITNNFLFIFVCSSLTGGFLFSLYFVPLNISVVKNKSITKGNSITISFIYLQTTFIIISSLVFAIVLGLMLVL